MTTAGRRIGVLGGTFDPIHVGHLDAAAAAQTALALDVILFIPANAPPHRSTEPRASAFHRFALAALALKGQDQYRLTDLELRRSGPSYTAVTLRELHEKGWRPSQIFFILGADAFAEIAMWHGYPAILDACHFAVIARPGTTGDAAFARTPSLRSRARPIAEATRETATTSVFFVDASTSAVSSSDIRLRLAEGRPIEGLVPPAVARHIHFHHLYTAVDDLHGED